MTNRTRLPVLLAAAATAAAVWTTATAGPPLICHPVAIGAAQSLPWAGNSCSRDYSSKSLVADTLRILTGDQSALVHMETLRRATIYIAKDRALALELLCGLMGRALDADADSTPDAMAWFDAGYFVQCLQQNGLPLKLDSGSSQGVAGYGWVRRALTLRPDDAELEFAAAMVTVMGPMPEHKQHMAHAEALAKEGSLLAQNLNNPALQHARQAAKEGHG